MTKLDVLYGASSSGSSSVTEAYPTFGIWSCYANNQYAQSVLDSYGNVVTSGYVNGASEGWNTWSGPRYTNGSQGSGSSGSTYAWGGTPMNQAEGNWHYLFPTHGMNYSNMIRHYGNSLADEWARFGVTIGPSGKRQKTSLYNNDTYFRVHRRGSIPLDGFTWSGATYANVTGSPGNTSRGMVGYNERTNTLVILTSGGANTYRMHVWKNPNISLNSDNYQTGDAHLFMSQAKAGTSGASYFYNDFTWSQSGSSNYDESRYHIRVIPGDNGYVGLVRMTPNYQSTHVYVVPNPASTSLTSGPTQISSVGLTTSYGIEQGNEYGMRSNITWDNEFVVAYCPYYYYLSGINAHFVSTKDPSYGYYFQDANTSWGFGVVPIGSSEFIFRNTANNSDTSSGIYAEIHSPRSMYEYGVDSNGSSVSNGGYSAPQGFYFAVDKGYTSTDYPHFAAMTSWRKAE